MNWNLLLDIFKDRDNQLMMTMSLLLLPLGIFMLFGLRRDLYDGYELFLILAYVITVLSSWWLLSTISNMVKQYRDISRIISRKRRRRHYGTFFSNPYQRGPQRCTTGPHGPFVHGTPLWSSDVCGHIGCLHCVLTREEAQRKRFQSKYGKYMDQYIEYRCIFCNRAYSEANVIILVFFDQNGVISYPPHPAFLRP